jgi:deoxyribose-phosphate aldolase
VNSSTGFAVGGAEDEKIVEMICVSAGRILIKSSGGIRDYNRARHFLTLGCSRIGLSCSSLETVLSGSSL